MFTIILRQLDIIINEPILESKITTLLVQTFACRNFRGDKLSRSPRDKINFREYKLSRKGQLRNFVGINFRDRGKFRLNFPIFMRILTVFLFLVSISRVTSKVRFRGYKLSRVALTMRFRGYKLSRTPKIFAKSRKFLPAKVCTNKVFWRRQQFFMMAWE